LVRLWPDQLSSFALVKKYFVKICMIVKNFVEYRLIFFCISAVHMALSRNIHGKDIALPEIPNQPHHLAATFIYPKCEFGKKTIVR